MPEIILVVIAAIALVGVAVCLVIQARGIGRLRAHLAWRDSCAEPPASSPKPKRWLKWPPQSHAEPYPDRADCPSPRVFEEKLIRAGSERRQLQMTQIQPTAIYTNASTTCCGSQSVKMGKTDALPGAGVNGCCLKSGPAREWDCPNASKAVI